MPKRKSSAPDPELDFDNEDGSERSLVNIDFDFFDPHPDVDYLALKRLATQLFQGDAQLFYLNDFVDLILSQPLVGTTVKCDGRGSDPYAILTVLNVHAHQKHPSIKALIEYALRKSTADPAFHATLQDLLGPAGLSSSNHVGFLFSERLINMPAQVTPHMYRMLADEIQWALDDNEPYNFTHFVIITRIYRLSPEEEAELQDSAPRSKRPKQVAHSQTSSGGVYPFHPEDEHLQKIALHSLDYNFTHALPREESSLGLDMGGRMMLLPASRLRELVKTLNEAYPPPS